MTRSARVLGILVMVLVPASARSQVRVESAVLYEGYDFAKGFAIGGTPEISGVSQMSVPFMVAIPLGKRVTLTASGGFVRVEVTPAAGTEAIDPVAGPTDTEVRLEMQLVPDHLVFIATGAAPTGQGSLEVQQTALLTVLVRDVLGFSTRTLGSGGHYGGGLAGAVKAGNVALGFAGTYTQFASYEPVVGTHRRLQPAGELRLRAGVEGPVGDGGYIRAAGIFSRRGQDRINGGAMVESNNRLAAYLSYDGRVKNGSFLAYFYDLYRAGAQLEGAVILPKANLVAAGLEITLPVARNTRILPRIELRRSDQAVGTGDTLGKLGASVRFGADLRQRLSQRAALVFEASGLTGSLASDAEAATADVGMTGYRLGARLEVAR